MVLGARPLDQLEEDDLTELIAKQVPEGRALDYKRELPGGSDADKRELLYDLSSFANAGGGHIVYGMEETRGLPVALPGLGSVDPDSAVLRLDSAAAAAIDPRILGLSFRAVPLSAGGHAVVVAIPKSTAAPHMVTFGGQQRFWSRNSAGKYQMSVAELRAAFTSAGLLAAIRLDVEATLGGPAPQI